MRKNFPTGTLVLFAIWVPVAAIVIAAMSALQPEIPDELKGVVRSPATPLRSFALKDQADRLFTLSSFEGKWTLLFFGYTYCPDVCPTTLGVLASLADRLQAESGAADDLQVVFVSVDPRRDTREVLASYLKYFQDDFIGVTGEQESIHQFANQFGAMFFEQKDAASENYLVSHTSSVFLINPAAEIVASFSPPHRRDTIASQYLAIRKLN